MSAIRCSTPGFSPGTPLAFGTASRGCGTHRSEEHTSELQSQSNLVCRLLLEKKKKTHQSACVERSQCVHRRADPLPIPSPEGEWRVRRSGDFTRVLDVLICSPHSRTWHRTA